MKKEEELPLPRRGLSKNASSFAFKGSQVQIGEGGTWQRPKYDETESSMNIRINQKLYSLMETYIPDDKQTIEKNWVKHIEYTLARTRFDIKTIHAYEGVAFSIRDRLVESFNDTHRSFTSENAKRVYYMSLEFLIGRCLQNALININLEEKYKDALMECGFALENLYDEEADPALGNGGLGRLAACFLDSLATLNYPAWGYGIRYDYGIFRQLIKDGYQIEAPDYWLTMGNPWEVERIDVQYNIKFYGNTRKVMRNGKEITIWEGTETVVARAYDTMVPGYATFNTLALRLWRSLPANQFNFESFNVGNYFQALEQRQKAEYITSVLYPNDHTYQGKQLRLKQEYLLSSASIQDIVRRHKNHARMHGKQFNWNDFSKEVAIQLNDTHPTLSIVELLRIMIDEEDIKADVAWEIIYQTFAYTNHTVLPQALERWDVQILHKLLPRHLELIYMINHVWLQKVSKKFPGNVDKLRELSIIQQSSPKRVKMANLCIVGSHAVNGVAQIHSDLIKTTLFKDFYEYFPNKFQNKTNGVTPRRWLVLCNPILADLLTEKLGSDEWILHMQHLKELQHLSTDPNFQNKWRAIKQHNKKRLVDWVKKNCHIDIDVESLFDIQVKRMHEYKRQFMNILYAIHRYLSIKSMSPQERKTVQPRTIMFGGKSAPGYTNAKRIIKLINEVGNVVNNDPLTKNLLKVVFLPNYNVSNAQIIIPASELSQHISTAGTEASGTSNMKFIMNGCLIVGTMDGANVEICQEIGQENAFIFGARVNEVQKLKEKMRNSPPESYIPPELKRVFGAITEGRFGSKDVLSQLVGSVTNNNDYYLVCHDFPSYIQIQNQVDKVYQNKQQWTKRSILSCLRSHKFSSDRTIHEYAQDIWGIKPIITAKDIKCKQEKKPERRGSEKHVTFDEEPKQAKEGLNKPETPKKEVAPGPK